MKFTRINDFFKLFVVILAIISLISVSLTSCGGGGGGGGGGGAAAGPAEEAEGEEVAEEGSVSTPAPTTTTVLSSNADMISFTFTQTDNPVLAANLSGSPQTVNDVSTVTVYYLEGTQQPQDFASLKPTIELSAGATISPASGVAQDFTNPVEYTVTAEDGTTKIYTVTVAQRDAGQFEISYDYDGGSYNGATEPPRLYRVAQGATLPANDAVTKPNYYFAGWMDQDNLGQIVSSWSSHQREGDVHLKARWVKAPYVDGDIIYANGIHVTVKKIGSKTMISFKDENGNDKNLCDINNAEEYQDLTGKTLYLGRAGNINASDMPFDNGRVTMESGNLSAIYGYNGDGNNIPLNVRIELKGGTVSAVIGFNRADASKPTTEVILSGNPTVGNKSTSGIWLTSFTTPVVTVNGSLSSNAEAITLIANHSNISEGTIVATFVSGTADAGKFKLVRDDGGSVNVNADGSNIVTIGSFNLPDPAKVTWTGNDQFTLGTGNVTTGGTIFSVFADGGYLTVTETSLAGAKFDMGIPLDSNYKENGYDKTLSTSKNYRYIQFTSESGNITATNADTYLSKILFHTIGGASVKVRINLETVPITTINDSNVTYLDGSYYKAVLEHKTWDEAYNLAKQQKFNGLTGYLMTITSEAENKFIYDQLFKNKGISANNASAWLGASRSINQSGTFDAESWSINTSKLNDYWNWVCGPEAGKKFYTKATTKDGGVAADKDGGGKWYVSWNSGEPNNSGTEYCAQYCGTYIWNDLNNVGNGSYSSQYYVKYYVVEFTPYEATAYGPGQRATKTALHAEREYSH